jgi:6-phosphogluconolactonase
MWGALSKGLLGAIALLIAGFVMSSAEAATFLYVGNAESQDITIFELKRNGEVVPVASVAVPGPAKPGGTLPMAISPNKRFLYAALRSEPFSVATFAIDAKSGKLDHRGSSPLADSMAYISTDRSGRFLLSASYPGHKVTVNPIDRDGVVRGPQEVIPTEPHAHAILTDSSNRYAFYTALGGDGVFQAKFDAKTGKLSPNEPPVVRVKAKAGPRHLVLSPNKKFVYLLNELDASIYVFPYDAGKGTMGKESQVVSTLPKGFEGKPWAADIHLTPDGKFLYASERNSNSLAAFKVDGKNGTLTSIENVVTEKQPRGFAIDPSGRYLFAVGQLSHSMTSYAIDKTSGKLTKLNQYPVGKNPNWIEIVSLP